MSHLISKFVVFFVILAFPLFANATDWQNQSIEELEKSATSLHPAGFYFLAIKLFENGEKDRSVFWFYVGQIRYRFHLMSSPSLDPSGDPALFSSLQQVVGTPINEYAGGDVALWAASVSDAIVWDNDNLNEFTSKSEYASEYREVQNGANRLLDYIRENAEEIRAQRAKNGLQNR